MSFKYSLKFAFLLFSSISSSASCIHFESKNSAFALCAAFANSPTPSNQDEDKNTKYFKLSLIHIFPNSPLLNHEVSDFKLCKLFGKHHLPGFDHYQPDRILGIFGKAKTLTDINIQEHDETALTELKCVAYGRDT